jgi:hypothetical protein
VPELRHTLSRAVESIGQEVREPALAIDGYVGLTDLTLEFVAELNRLAPFGRENPPLTLVVRDLGIVSDTTIGRTEEHRRLTVEDEDENTGTVFWWHGAGWPLPRTRFDLALTARASDFRGISQVQLEWLDARPLVATAEPVEVVPTRRVLDLRGVADPLSALQQLAAGHDVQIWAEAGSPAGFVVRGREKLGPSTRLVLWTLPPGPKELADALARVRPDQIALFDHDPAGYDSQALLQKVAGMAKYALRARQGHFDLGAAAARLAHRTVTVQTALEYLHARGMLSILQRSDRGWQLAAEQAEPDSLASENRVAQLKTLLEETAAYREYARSAPNPIPDSQIAGSQPAWPS